MSFYENLVMQAQMNYSRHYRLYAAGKAPYQMSDKKALPYERLAAREPRAVYVTVNLGEIFIPEEIRDKAYGLDGDLAEILHELAREAVE